VEVEGYGTTKSALVFTRKNIPFREPYPSPDHRLHVRYNMLLMEDRDIEVLLDLLDLRHFHTGKNYPLQNAQCIIVRESCNAASQSKRMEDWQ